ncbi:MAG: PEP-CTERM sorting domain-containing protein [Pirellulales bacterium]|nr:PEP-CTERM sorting domain-containing protein [Pirellulales bacterium]
MRLHFVRLTAVDSRARRFAFFSAAILAALVVNFGVPVVAYDVTGSIGQNFFNGFTINEGSSGTAALQLNVSPANSSGFAGTTTHRINGGNPLTFSASGSTAGSATPTTGGDNGNGTADWSASFQYNLPGVYNISYGGTVSWLHSANGSWNPVTSNYSGTGFQGVGGNVNVTVNNVAPTITSANLNGINGDQSVGQGGSVSLNMTATDAGSQNTNFTINGVGAGSASGTPGSTRTSGNSSFSAVGVAPGVYAQTFQADDGITTASNGPVTRFVTVTNVGPTITSANINGVNGNFTVNEGVAVTLNMTATDPGNDIINFTINGGVAGSSPVQAGNSTRTSSDVGVGGFLPGLYTQTFQATDQYGAVDGPITRVLTVLNVGPTITGITPSQVIDPTQPFNFFMTATDPGVALGDTLTYNWDWDDDGQFDDYTGSSGTIPANYFPNAVGTHKVSGQVTDSNGDSATGSFVLTIVPEPSTVLMAGLGAAGLGLVAARRKVRRRKEQPPNGS